MSKEIALIIPVNEKVYCISLCIMLCFTTGMFLMKIARKIRKKFSNISLMWKINLTGMLIILLFTILIYMLLLPFFEKEKLAERTGKLRAVVNSAVSLIDYYERTVRSREWAPVQGMPHSIDEAKKEIISRLREMRYDKTEFFFILDGDGNMIMHPLKPELEGKNMMDIVDPNGIRLFRQMVMESQKHGEAIVQYSWESKYSPAIIEPQITYARYYWQWDWIVCSSLYIQDIADAMNELRLRTAMYELIVAAAVMSLLFILVHFYLSKPFKELLAGIGEIRSGNLNHRIDISTLDEVGIISDEFNSMVSELNRSRYELIASEKKYRDLTELLPDIIYETDSELRINYLNRTGFTITGYTFDDLNDGLHLRNFLDKNEFDTLHNLFNDGTTERHFTKHVIYRKDGSTFYGENSMSILRKSGKPVLLRGSIRDITEKQKFEEQMMQSQKMETIGTLAGGLAHDFNNVLGGIVSTVSLMKFEIRNNRNLPASELFGYIEIMEKSGQRAADMVQQLLTLSRKRETEFVAVDLIHTINNVKKICDSTLDKRINIRLDIRAGSAFVYADPTQMEQVLLNLCINAAHAMTIMKSEGELQGGNLIIAIEEIRGDSGFCEIHPEAEARDYWMLSVCDTGVGMDTQTIAHIFVPFFTTKEKGLGTGLGLSMVYTLVQQHGGFINVYSEKGIGSTFNIYLPVYSGGGSTPRIKESDSSLCGEGLILIIDDEDVMRKVAGNILRRCGYGVITASGGEEGIEIFAARHEEISAVLLDLAMPKISGDQVYDRLKAIDSSVKVILTSGFRQDERVEAAMKKGISAFIQKPYTLEKLADAVSKIITACLDKNHED